MTADACGRPVFAGPVEATALGNVMAQAVATGDLEGFAATAPRLVRFVSEFGACSVPDTDDFLDPGRWPDLDWEQFLGDAPKVGFSVSRFFQWRMYWDYAGGPATDLLNDPKVQAEFAEVKNANKRRLADYIERELGISEGTVWQGTPGSWVLIVTHYVFISADWEVDLAWHVMTPPNDWIRIQLRHRWTETAPSVAFEIPSAAGTASPREIAPDEAVWR